MGDSTLLLLTLIASLAAVVCGIFALVRKPERQGASRRDVEEVTAPLSHSVAAANALADATRKDLASTRQELHASLREQVDRVNAASAATTATLGQFQSALQTAFTEQQRLTAQQMLGVISQVQAGLAGIRESNDRKLDEIRGVVDEKLTSTLSTKLAENFQQIGSLLATVQSGLGQVQTLASDVSGLRRSIEGVRTRGAFGESLLEGLLEEFLQEDQFVRDYHPPGVKDDRVRVEFAIKLPGQHPEDADKPIYLPIDAKYPKERYDALLACAEAGDKDGVAEARRQLVNSIRDAARDIKKYIHPPTSAESSGTTDFAIMYLPLESLFAEVARERGLLETVQREFKVTIASPTTLAALLSALRVGFRTLEVQRDHAKIGVLLSVVRTEFQKFANSLADVDDRLDKTKAAVEKSIQRTALIDKRLRGVAIADEETVERLLPSAESVDEPRAPVGADEG